MDVQRIRRAYRRSRLLRDALRVLDSHGPLHVGELAARLGTSHQRVYEMVWGVLPAHKPEFSPVRLGLMRLVLEPGGLVVEVTDRGRYAEALIAGVFAANR